jgi:predicted RNA polymerase sigma factor
LEVRETLDAVYRTESRRVFATLVRLLGDFDLAEEALHEAFRAALEQWPADGVPANPRAWLVSAGRFKAIDNLRRQKRYVLPNRKYWKRSRQRKLRRQLRSRTTGCASFSPAAIPPSRPILKSP